MIVLDASVVIAHLASSDPHHERATAFFRARAADSFLMHSLTLTEVLVGPIRVGRGEAAAHTMTSLGIAEWAPPAQSAARLARIRVESGLKLPDCCVLDAALSTSAPLATLDVRLRHAAREAGVEVIDFG
ncbi:type II toxin-antitoxin system VapC family toxin [Agromyces protaetiae]|uniref:Ribonuclease VapC n=1 Tax=Agromyces protaetiae TaxID=2509455 RepID=A0A4P6FEM0_9MICO|nr:type II toxin-antitoxin system VapC family toxin [Agromyces protaetiae]QAY72147.1 type II toxin-antitoxin system VapC family toxin [Agromyces protaetiae]